MKRDLTVTDKQRHERYRTLAKQLYDELVADISVPAKVHREALFTMDAIDLWLAQQQYDAPTAPAAPAKAVQDDSHGFETGGESYSEIPPAFVADDGTGLEDIAANGMLGFINRDAFIPHPTPRLPPSIIDSDLTGLE